MHTVTQTDIDFAHRVLGHAYPALSRDSTLWDECESAALYGLTQAARTYGHTPGRVCRWLRWVEIKVTSAIKDTMRKESTQAGLGIAGSPFRSQEGFIDIIRPDGLDDWDDCISPPEKSKEEEEEEEREVAEKKKADMARKLKIIKGAMRACLTPYARKIFELRFFEGCTYSRIVERLDRKVTVNGACSLVHHHLPRLKRYVEDKYMEENMR